MRGTTPQTPRSVKKEGEEVLQAPEQRDSPAAHGEDHAEAGCPPELTELHGDIHLQPVEDPTPEQLDARRTL